MSARFEILDWQDTPMGQLSLRRRHEPVLDVEIYEVQLNDEHLMSSLFTHSESELARLGVAGHDADDLDVVVGGLGLGYTALAALAEPRVGSVTVVEALEPVIDWHRRRLLPDSVDLATDPRCRLVHDDFFALVAEQRSATRYDVVLLDIDHTPGPRPPSEPRRLLLAPRAAPTDLAPPRRRRLRALVGRPAGAGLPRKARRGLRHDGQPRGDLSEPAHPRCLLVHRLRRPNLPTDPRGSDRTLGSGRGPGQPRRGTHTEDFA